MKSAAHMRPAIAGVGIFQRVRESQPPSCLHVSLLSLHLKNLGTPRGCLQRVHAPTQRGPSADTACSGMLDSWRPGSRFG
eukprot:16738_4